MDDPPCANDVTGYKLYYSETTEGSFGLLAEFENKYDTAYNHFPEESLTGCYFITAIDSFR